MKQNFNNNNNFLQFIKYTCSCMTTKECKIKLWNCKNDIFVEKIQNHFRYTNIILSSMIKYKFP